MQVGKIHLDTMPSADSISTLDIDKVLDVASRRMGYERLFPEAVEAFISGRDAFVCLSTGCVYFREFN